MLYTFVTPSHFRNLNESTMRMLASLWRVPCSANVAAWKSDFWVESNELAISTCIERHRHLTEDKIRQTERPLIIILLSYEDVHAHRYRVAISVGC